MTLSFINVSLPTGRLTGAERILARASSAYAIHARAELQVSAVSHARAELQVSAVSPFDSRSRRRLFV